MSVNFNGLYRVSKCRIVLVAICNQYTSTADEAVLGLYMSYGKGDEFLVIPRLYHSFCHDSFNFSSWTHVNRTSLRTAIMFLDIIHRPVFI
jgi:hypothetical protein